MIELIAANVKRGLLDRKLLYGLTRVACQRKTKIYLISNMGHICGNYSYGSINCVYSDRPGKTLFFFSRN